MALMVSCLNFSPNFLFLHSFFTKRSLGNGWHWWFLVARNHFFWQRSSTLLLASSLLAGALNNLETKFILQCASWEKRELASIKKLNYNLWNTIVIDIIYGLLFSSPPYMTGSHGFDWEAVIYIFLWMWLRLWLYTLSPVCWFFSKMLQNLKTILCKQNCDSNYMVSPGFSKELQTLKKNLILSCDSDSVVTPGCFPGFFSKMLKTYSEYEFSAETWTGNVRQDRSCLPKNVSKALQSIVWWMWVELHGLPWGQLFTTPCHNQVTKVTITKV